MSSDTKAIIGTIIGTVSGASLALAALILQGHANIGERLNRLDDRTADLLERTATLEVRTADLQERTADLQERVAHIEATLAAQD